MDPAGSSTIGTMAPGYYVGVDLGTTNTTCCVGQVTEDDEFSLRQLPIWQLGNEPGAHDQLERDEILPSVVWFRGGGDVYTGDYCKGIAAEGLREPEARLVRSIKRQMGNDSWGLESGGQRFTPRHIAGLILRTVQGSLHPEIPEAGVQEYTITIPASFSSKMRHETLLAAQLAGLDPARTNLVDEPVAALFSDWSERDGVLADLPVGETPVLVFDMGGGTLDVSVIEVHRRERRVRVASTSRYNEVAGDDLDLEIAALLLQLARQDSRYDGAFLQIDNTTAEGRQRMKALGLGMMELAETTKLALGDIMEGLPHRGTYREKIDRLRQSGDAVTVDIGAELPGSPSTLEVPCHSLLEVLAPFFRASGLGAGARSIFVPLKQALDRAGLEPDQIGRIYITGGSAYFPPVIDTLASYFCLAPTRLDPFHAVSRGAAVFSHIRQAGRWHVEEKVSDSVFLKRAGHEFLEVLGPVAVPCEPEFKDLDEDECPHLSSGRGNVRLEFFQGMDSRDPLMTLAHVESLGLERELGENARLTQLEGRIDRNKVYQFRLWFQDDDGVVQSEVSFGVKQGAAAAGTLPGGLRLNGVEL